MFVKLLLVLLSLAVFDTHLWAQGKGQRDRFLYLTEIFQMVATAKKSGVPDEKLQTLRLQNGFNQIILKEVLPARELFFAKLPSYPDLLYDRIPYEDGPLVNDNFEIDLLSYLTQKFQFVPPKDYFTIRDMLDELAGVEEKAMIGFEAEKNERELKAPKL